jgi:hypothetical protein
MPAPSGGAGFSKRPRATLICRTGMDVRVNPNFPPAMAGVGKRLN